MAKLKTLLICMFVVAIVSSSLAEQQNNNNNKRHGRKKIDASTKTQKKPLADAPLPRKKCMCDIT